MDTQHQIDNLIELAIVQRAELKQLVEQIPQLREHLTSEIEKTFEAVEPELRQELEEFFARKTEERVDLLRGEVSERVAEMLKSLEMAAAAKYSALMTERARNAELLEQAEQKIAEAAASIPGKVKDIVTDELARFPRAGEIEQLRKEFAEPRGLNPRGKWLAGESYNKLDLVTINGDSYVSNIDGNTEKPSRGAANWTLNAARGNSGGGGGITSLNDLIGPPSAGDIIGSEGSAYVRKTLTAGTGISITEDPSTITIDASGAQELLTATVKNAESVAITKGQVVYLFGATGNMPSVKLAYNTSDATSAKTFGVVSSTSISPNGTGTVTCVGVLDGLNLGAFNEGDTVYLGATPGTFTATKPYAPNHLVYVGIVERANAGNGELYVKIQNGYELDEIHDVQINSPRLSGQTLIYDATTSLWKNAQLTAGVGVSISNGASSITISADGGVNYQGTWNASTNTPTLTSSVGTKGFYYVVSVAGTTNLNGVTDWQVGDWAIFNGTAWEKVDTTDQVSSVFGRTGAVVGVSTDYSAVGITNTAIGASNPSTGAFTSLSSSSTTTLNGTTIPASKTLVVTTDKLSALASTSSAELAGVISDETGTGALVFANSPTLVTPNLGTPSALVGTNITGTAAGLTAGNVTTNANLTGDVTSVGNATSIAAGVIVDADINASAAIADTKLATISTALKVSNSATTATSANTASAIVARDSSGNFSAGTITANLTGNVSGSSGSTTGNAATATALATGRTIAITGDLVYTSPSFDGTSNVTAAGTLATVATAGTTGSSTAIPIVTINAKGLTTSISTAAVIAPAGTLTGNTLASGVTASSLTSLGTIANLTATAGTIATTPTGSTDIANKLYVDTVAQGLDAKASCVAATTADITLSGAQTIDGVSVVAGNRVLVKNQSLSQNNGIYVCASGAWTRATDADTWDKLTSAFTFIEQGTVNADCGFVCTANTGGTLGTTALPWSQFSGAGTFTAGTGLTLTGSVFSLTSPVAVANGGTGLTSLGAGITTFLGTPSSANLASAVSDETGTGALVFANTPTLVTPILGTPQSGTLTNCTGLPVSTGVSGLGTNVATALAANVGTAGSVVVNGGALGTPSSGTLTNATGLPIATGVSGLGTNVATFLATPSSANLAAAVSDETGTGALVFANTPTLVTPNIGAATGTSFNLSGSGTLGTTLVVNGTTDSSSKDTGAIVTEGGLGVEKSATIGGNATVAGALTVNGGSVTLTGAAYSIFYADGSSGGNFTIRKAGVAYGTLYGNETNTVLDSAGSANLILQTGGATRVTMNSTRVSIPLTTASTSTSTGALVVGGGVGVAGAINTGGSVYVRGSSHVIRIRQDDAIIDFTNTAENAYATGTIIGNTVQLKGNNGTGLTIGTTGNATFAGTLTVSSSGVSQINGTLLVGAQAASGASLDVQTASGTASTLRLYQQGVSNWVWSVPASTDALVLSQYGTTEAMRFNSSRNALFASTTASTSTSTGALVVSGGVGVAGAVYAGGKVVVNGGDASAAQFAVASASGTLAANLTAGSTTNQSFGLRMFAGTSASDYGLFLRNVTDTTTLFKVDGVGGTTVGGTLTVNNSFGVGAAPTSSWASGYYALEVGNTSTKRAALFANADNNLWLLSNAYFDGSSFKRFAASSATGYEQVNGEHKWSYAASGSAGASISFTTGMTLNSSGNLQIAATTASTSTSTGALVVSGGVGVAGAINVGGKVQFPSDTTSTRAVAFGSDINFFRRGDNTFGFTGSAGSGIQLTCGTDPYLQGIAGSGYIRFFDAGSTVIASSGTVALTLTTAQKAEFAATIKTAAPAGGTAAEWKLGTVASVSPTSPNRTIEVDIGGTIYYIHAKTTNN